MLLPAFELWAALLPRSFHGSVFIAAIRTAAIVSVFTKLLQLSSSTLRHEQGRWISYIISFLLSKERKILTL